MKEIINVLKKYANKISIWDVNGNGSDNIVLYTQIPKEDLDIIENNISYAGMICYLTKNIGSLSEEYLNNLQKSLDLLDKSIISEKQFIYLMFLQQQDDYTYEHHLFKKVQTEENLKTKEDVQYAINLFKTSADRIEKYISSKIEYRL